MFSSSSFSSNVNARESSRKWRHAEGQQPTRLPCFTVRLPPWPTCTLPRYSHRHPPSLCWVQLDWTRVPLWPRRVPTLPHFIPRCNATWPKLSTIGWRPCWNDCSSFCSGWGTTKCGFKQLTFCSSLFFLMSLGINGIGLYYWYFTYVDLVEKS